VVNSVRAKPELCAHLFKYDSVFGRFPGTVEHDEDHLVIDGRPVRITAQADPLLCPWHAFDVDVVVEATGRFTHRDDAVAHRRARAATLNMTPTKTGAARAIDQVMPHLAGRIVGIAVRVPIPDVSLVDLSATLDVPVTVEDINDAFREAAGGRLRGVLDVTEEPLV